MILITLIFINAPNNLSYIKNQRLIENEIISNKKINLERYPDGKSKELRNHISKKFH